MAPITDPKIVVDSVGDGVAEIMKIYPRVIEEFGGNAQAYGRAIENDFSALQSGMPDRPEALATFVVGIVGHTVEAMLKVPVGVAKAVGDTASGISSQVGRVSR